VRYKLLSEVCGAPYGPLSREEVADYPQALNDYTSHVWVREMARGYREIITGMIDILRGRRNRGLDLKTSLPTLENEIHYRSLWIRAVDFREATKVMIKELDETLWWLNVQMIGTWITRSFRFPRLSFLDGLSEKDLHEQMPAIDTFTYMTGRNHFGHRVHDAYDQMMSAKADDSLKGLFKITSEQLEELATALIKGRAPNTSLFERPEEPANIADEETERHAGVAFQMRGSLWMLKGSG